jgi:hypothetical protein
MEGVAMYAPLCAFDSADACNRGDFNLDDYQQAYLLKRFAKVIFTGSLSPAEEPAAVPAP